MREKFNAIIDQVNKERDQGRPVLVGTTSVEVSELLSKMLKLRGVRHNVLNAKQHQREADIVAEAGKAGSVTIATNMAGRGTDIKLGDGVKDAGGLAILGTERHDSRRIDRQLRGRSGRQGDPGSSLFYVSLEDNLMRLFGSERIAKTMDRFGFKEGEVLEHSMVTKSLERAQKKVEENNFGIRKRLLEYDDVMNIQRENIYKKRKHALWGDRLSVDINNSLYDLCDEVAMGSKTQNNNEVFNQDAIRYFGLESSTDLEEFEKLTPDELSDSLFVDVQRAYKNKSEGIAKMAYPFIKDVYENKGDSVQNVVIPFTDGNKVIQVVVDLKKAYETQGESIIKTFEKNISLAIIDETWKTHLKKMDDLKQSVQSAVYEQKDPLIIYKMEAYHLFKRMLINLNKEISNFIFKGVILAQDPNEAREAKARRQKEELHAHRNEGLSDNGEVSVKKEPVRVSQKIGRNQACPCGSGKKYKHCHGK
jgi:preprotein translocase subunit SecA